MRTLTSDQEQLLKSANRASHGRVRIKDSGGTWRDLSALPAPGDGAPTDWVMSTDVSDDVDQVVQSATINLRLRQAELSLAPLMSDSKYNVDYGGEPLIDLDREIEMQVCTLPIGQDPVEGDWVTLYHGYTGDGEDATPFQANGLSLQTRDLGKRLQDAMIESVASYGSSGGVAAETVIQSLLDDTLGAGVVSLYTPTASSFVIKTYSQQKQDLMTAIQSIAGNLGWIAKYCWDNGSGAFRFTFFEPDRTKSVADWTLGPADYKETTLGRDSKGVRNAIGLSYYDTDGALQSITPVTDATSISKYRRKYMEPSLAATAHIHNDTDGTALANAILSDQKEPKATKRITIPFLAWHIEVGDLIQLDADDRTDSTGRALAVVSVNHHIEAGKMQTVLTCRGAPSAGYLRWLLNEARSRVIGLQGASSHNIADKQVQTKHLADGAASGSALGAVASGTSFPSSPSAGQFFFRTDTSYLYRYDGFAWTRIDITDLGSMSGAVSGSQIGPVQEGTSFPGSPSAGLLFFRTDQGYLYRYDGSTWVRVDIADLPSMSGQVGNSQIGTGAVHSGNVSGSQLKHGHLDAFTHSFSELSATIAAQGYHVFSDSALFSNTPTLIRPDPRIWESSGQYWPSDNRWLWNGGAGTAGDWLEVLSQDYGDNGYTLVIVNHNPSLSRTVHVQVDLLLLSGDPI